ncbi:MAG: protein kinase [Chloroflexales bacterium]|nr:protein kinase [Chloroflexales bacterium]
MANIPRTAARAAANTVGGAHNELRNYRLLDRIGEDDLATSYNATHLTLDRPVVVHLLRHTDWVSVSRFQLAAKLAARLSHPSLVPVLDAGHDERSGYYLVTPSMEAQPLSAVLANGRLDAVQALSVARQVGAALDYLHGKGVVHRDIQPLNILLTKEGLAYLTNLSFAASPDTPDFSSVEEADYLTVYSAPELELNAAEAAPALDVYGLGGVIYHMLGGSPPPGDGSAAPPLGADPMLSAADRVVQRMMAAQPGARYGSVGQALGALRQALRAQIDRATDDMEESRWETSAEWLENPLETVLGDVLDQEFTSRTRARADSLHRVDAVRRLLDRWSRKGRFRRAPLGQLIQPEQITSFNIYYYDLRTYYETRSAPAPRTRPARPDERSSMLPSIDVWDVDVPLGDEVNDVREQELSMPNSLRVISCSECGGQGKVVCKACSGRGTVDRTRAVKNPDGSKQNETIQEQCQNCHGYGRQTCPSCDGSGNIAEEQVFSWSRRAKLWQNTDDMDGLPKLALERRAEPVYSAVINPYEGRWHSVAPLAELIEAAVKACDDHTHIRSAELSIRGATLTEVDYTLNDKSHRLTLVGNDNEISGDWSLVNWERIALVAVGAVLAVVLVALVVANLL